MSVTNSGNNKSGIVEFCGLKPGRFIKGSTNLNNLAMIAFPKSGSEVAYKIISGASIKAREKMQIPLASGTYYKDAGYMSSISYLGRGQFLIELVGKFSTDAALAAEMEISSIAKAMIDSGKKDIIFAAPTNENRQLKIFNLTAFLVNNQAAHNEFDKAYFTEVRSDDRVLASICMIRPVVDGFFIALDGVNNAIVYCEINQSVAGSAILNVSDDPILKLGKANDTMIKFIDRVRNDKTVITLSGGNIIKINLITREKMTIGQVAAGKKVITASSVSKDSFIIFDSDELSVIPGIFSLVGVI